MSKKHSQPEEIDEDQLAADVAKSTEEIEAEKEQRKHDREERKFLKEQKRKSQRRQRFVAPVLLLLTILVSLFIWTFSK